MGFANDFVLASPLGGGIEALLAGGSIAFSGFIAAGDWSCTSALSCRSGGTILYNSC